MEAVRATAGLLLLLLLLAACSKTEKSSTTTTDAVFWFTDVTESAGISWNMVYGTDPTDFILETTGSGPAWLDFDRDGDLDLYLVNGSHFNPDSLAKYRPSSALYQNNGDGTFTDVTESAGTGHVGWGCMALTADFDGDGWTDIYVTAWGANSYYHNNGDGTFTESAAKAGIDDPSYSTAAAAIDFDSDGLLDIFVANYVDFDPATAEKPGTSYHTITRGMPTSTVPEGYSGAKDLLFHNLGDGTFGDVAKKEGLNHVNGRGLGAITLDYDDDGLLDLYVANDAMGNFLYRRTARQSKAFEETGANLGAAYAEGGLGAGSMGLAVGDIDGDGTPEILATNYEDQMISLYQLRSGKFFQDVTLSKGVGGPTLVRLQWGTTFADFDLDGDLDLFIASGHVSSRMEPRYLQSTFVQPNQLFVNSGGGQFSEATSRSGPALGPPYFSSRGSAVADFDNDGDMDVVVVNKSGPARLLRNDTPRRKRHWLGMDVGQNVGTHVTLYSEGSQQVREVRLGSSYAATEDRRLLFGLGETTKVDSVVIRWPIGESQTWHPPGIDAYHAVVIHK